METFGRSPDSRRARARVLDTAEGVLMSTVSLADALVALAQNQASQDGDDAALGAAGAAWGHLLDRARPRRNVQFGRDDDGVPSA